MWMSGGEEEVPFSQFEILLEVSVPRYKKHTQDDIPKLIAEGRGQGEGENYIPWIKVQEISSRGRTHLVRGNKTNRTHHLFSDNEHKYFLIADCSQIEDIREQYPLLPLDETLDIADQLVIQHPKIPGTSSYNVFTTDILLTVTKGPPPIFWGRSIKPVEALSHDRTIEKLMIEAEYWRRREIDWGIIVPNQDISEVMYGNYKLLHQHYHLRLKDLTPDQQEDIRKYLSENIHIPNQTLSSVTKVCDESLGFERGTSLGVAYHLIVRGVWRLDLSIKLDPNQPLAFEA